MRTRSKNMNHSLHFCKNRRFISIACFLNVDQLPYFFSEGTWILNAVSSVGKKIEITD